MSTVDTTSPSTPQSAASPSAPLAPGAAANEPAAAPALFRWRWLVLAIVLCAEVMDLLDGTIVTIAAPTIRNDIGGGEATLQWLTAAYLLPFAVLLVLGGRLGDRFGRRRMFLIGVTGFTLASLACALAQDPSMLIAARVLQGGFGAVLIPQGLGLIKQVFPAEQIGGAFAAFGPVMGLSAVGGPILAGVLLDHDVLGAQWRIVFLINLPIGLTALCLALIFLPHTPAQRSIRIDPISGLILTAASVAVIYPLIQGRELGWPVWVWLLLAAGVALFGGFGWYERRVSASPLITPSLLTKREFTGGMVVAIAFFTGMTGLMLVLSLFAQLGLGYSPLRTGLTLAPLAFGIALASVIAFMVMAKLGRLLLQIGLAITVIGMLLLAWQVDRGGMAIHSWAIAWPMFIVGLGMGNVLAPLFNVILAGVDEDEVGTASGTLSAIQQLGSAIGIAVITTIFFQFAGHSLPSAAMVHTTEICAVLFAVAIGLVFLLPREARMDVEG